MKEAHLRIFFIAVFAVSFGSIITDAHIFPSIRFPQFPSKYMGKHITYSEVKLYSYRSSKEVDLMSVVQPYDKQYYLFILRALANKETADNMLAFVNKTYQRRFQTNDSLYFTTETKTVGVP